MTEQTNQVPKRRIKGFTQEWKESYFFENVKNTIDFRGRTPKKLGLEWSSTGYLALSALNVKNGYIDFNADSHYGNQELYDKWMAGRELRKGQVLFTTEAPMGNVAQVPDNRGYILSQRTIAFDVNPEKITDDFLASLLRSPKVFAELSALSSGGTAKGVSQKSLSQLKIRIPTSLEEQAIIGDFLNIVDKLITLQQVKLEKTKALKSAYLSEMFPAEGEFVPKRRFVGFTQDWVQCKWTDTVSISTNMVNPKSGEYDNLLHVGPGNIESFSGQLYDNVRTVKEDKLISGKFHFHKGDIIYGKINPQLGKYIYAPFEGLASADAYVLNAKDGFDQTFLFALIQTQHFFKYSVSVSMRSGMPKINRDELNEFEFKAPNLHEQKCIGELFLQLDGLISLHRRKLEKLQNLKKACLHEMFV